MASPQVKNGFTAIANEVIEALARADLPGREMRVLLIIMRKTWGWHKKEDNISIGQLATALGVRRHALVPVVKRLEKRSFVKRGSTRSRTTAPKLSFNKNYEEWDGGIHSLTHSLFPSTPERTRGSTQEGFEGSTRQRTRGSTLAPTLKRKGKKEIKNKERESSPFSIEKGMQPIGELIRKRHGR